MNVDDDFPKRRKQRKRPHKFWWKYRITAMSDNFSGRNFSVGSIIVERGFRGIVHTWEFFDMEIGKIDRWFTAEFIEKVPVESLSIKTEEIA